MHMDIASMVLAVRAGCAPRCTQSARLSVFNLHGNHGLAWSCGVEDCRALLACCGQYAYGYSEHGASSARRLRA